jgi:hypothetical protein
LYSCPSRTLGNDKTCSLLNTVTNCEGCIHIKGASLLATIGINILGALIHNDPNFDVMVEVENQIALSNAGIEPVVTEKYMAYPDDKSDEDPANWGLYNNEEDQY